MKTYLFSLRHWAHFLVHLHGVPARLHAFLCHPSCHDPSHQDCGSDHGNVHGRGGHNLGRGVHSRGHGGHNLGHDGHSPVHTCRPYEGSSHHDHGVEMGSVRDGEDCGHVDDRGLSRIAKTQMGVFEPTNRISQGLEYMKSRHYLLQSSASHRDRCACCAFHDTHHPRHGGFRIPQKQS